MRSLATLESHFLIGDAVDRFVRERSPMADLASLASGDPDWRPLWAECAELGLLALAHDEARGGLGGDPGMIAVVAAALGPGLLAAPFVESAIIGGTLLSSLPENDDIIAQTAAGEILVTLIHDGTAIRHVRDGDAILLDGHARAQPFAAEADRWLVVAHGDTGPALFLVDRHAPGLTVEGYRLIDAHRAADVRFDRTRLPATTPLLEGAAVDTAVARALRNGRLAAAAEAFGIMGRLIALTADYLRTRVQFGVAIGSFQALQHRLADMQIDYAKCHASLVQCCATLAAGEDDTAQDRAALASYVVVEAAARRIGHEAIQLHGGIGATLDMPTSHLNSRLAAIRRFGGGADAALLDLVRLDGLN